MWFRSYKLNQTITKNEQKVLVLTFQRTVRLNCCILLSCILLIVMCTGENILYRALLNKIAEKLVLSQSRG